MHDIRKFQPQRLDQVTTDSIVKTVIRRLVSSIYYNAGDLERILNEIKSMKLQLDPEMVTPFIRIIHLRFGVHEMREVLLEIISQIQVTTTGNLNSVFEAQHVHSSVVLQSDIIQTVYSGADLSHDPHDWQLLDHDDAENTSSDELVNLNDASSSHQPQAGGNFNNGIQNHFK
jgi:hypothetical protein